MDQKKLEELRHLMDIWVTRYPTEPWGTFQWACMCEFLHISGRRYNDRSTDMLDITLGETLLGARHRAKAKPQDAPERRERLEGHGMDENLLSVHDGWPQECVDRYRLIIGK